MNIVKKIDQYDEKYVFFCEPIKNNVMNDGNFIRILYSNNNFTLNGIYLLITLNDISCDKYYTKYKCNFNDTITNMLTENLKSWRNRRYSLLNNHNKTRFLEILGLCEKMGYIVNEDVFLHILKFFSDDKIIEYIDKWNLEIKDIIKKFRRKMMKASGRLNKVRR